MGSELRVVLLGGRREGKNSSGNTILGREEFDLRTTAQCVKRQGEVAGRQVTVVDTPGWWRNLPVERTTELVKQEMVHSVSLCPPGPHTLLVIRLDVSFTEEERRSVEGHLQPLSERAWSHTLVLFTHGDRLGDTTIEQHIETEGKDLQWLVEKCGNRYHVLNNKNMGDDTQVTELLDKMEEMVAGNRGGHYEMDREILEKMEEKRRAEEERAHQRLMKVQEQRETLRSLMEWEGGRSDVLSQTSSRSASDHNSEEETERSPHIRLKTEPAHSWTSAPQEPTPTIVTPELSSQSPEKYRLQCPHAGVFQCSLTGLGFQMEEEGEVLYNIVQWDEDLLASTGQTPAGPLFSIDCPRGSVCQLHLPHCEMVPGEGLGSLSVAHVSGDNVELLPPLRVTDTHVVVNVTDLSLWGLLRRFLPFTTIWAQVLPFLESQGPLGSVLHLIIVPANVPPTEVISFFKGIHKESSYRSASPVHCSLTRGATYSLSCTEAVKIQPEHAEIYWSYGPNYHPTFQVLLSADTEEVKLSLLEKDGGEQVWAACIQLRAPGASSMGGSQTEHAQSGSAEEPLGPVLLLITLEELDNKELKVFQWWMKQSRVLDGFPPIPERHLENADRLNTVDTMVQTYTLEGALKISVEILKRMNQNVLYQKLEAGMERSTSSPAAAVVHLTDQTGAPEASSMGGEQSGSAEERLRSARRDFVRRVSRSVIDRLLDELLEKRVINEEERDAVEEEKERAERARILIDMVLRKGDQSCSVMMDLLADLDSFLYSWLGFN